jgi:hypothetical protein
MFDNFDDDTFKKLKTLVISGVIVIAFLVGMLLLMDTFGAKRTDTPTHRRPIQLRPAEPERYPE